MGLPLQHEMDMSDPRQHLLWALMKMNEQVSAPLILPLPAYEEQSQHLYDCGFRHHPELQTKTYRPPKPDASLWDGMAGEWVKHPPGEPPKDFEAAVSSAIGSMSPAMRAELKRQLTEGGDSDGGDPGPGTA